MYAVTKNWLEVMRIRLYSGDQVTLGEGNYEVVQYFSGKISMLQKSSNGYGLSA